MHDLLASLALDKPFRNHILTDQPDELNELLRQDVMGQVRQRDCIVQFWANLLLLLLFKKNSRKFPTF